MFDGSAGWDYVDALEFGKAIQDLGFLWYEEPMREFYLGAYTKLCEKLDIPILAAETSDGVHWNMASWIEASALDMTRVSSFYKGGFTGSMKIAHMSESFGMRAQVHGMGLENAQLCAAISNNDYYEQLDHERGADQGPRQARPLVDRRRQPDRQRRAGRRLQLRLRRARQGGHRQGRGPRETGLGSSAVAAVELRNVSKSFGTVGVIEGVDLTIDKGEFVVFVGPPARASRRCCA